MLQCNGHLKRILKSTEEDQAVTASLDLIRLFVWPHYYTTIVLIC